MRKRTAILLVMLFVSIPARFKAQSPTVKEVVRMEQTGGVQSVIFSPDGRYLATGGGDSSVRLWEVPGGREVARFIPDFAGKKGWASSPYGLAFTPDGRFVVAGNFDANVRVWEVASGRVIARMATVYGHGPADSTVVPYDFTISPDGRYLATASFDRLARVWEVATGREVARVDQETPIHLIAFSPDGRYLATGGYGPIIRVWESNTWKETARLELEQWVFAMAWTPEGHTLVTGSSDIRVWDAATGRESKRMKHEYGVNTMAISPDGRYLATLGSRSARVWEIASAREIARMNHKLRRDDTHAMSILFSPDGRYLAGASDSRTVLVWESATGREVARLDHKQEVLARMAFSPRGDYLATAMGRKGTVTLWSWQTTGSNSSGSTSPSASAQNTTPPVSPSPPAIGTKTSLPQPGPLIADEFETSGSRATILSAKTIKVIGVMGSVVPPRVFDRFDPNPAYAKKLVETTIRKWGRFQLADDTSEPDLVLVITEGINERIYRQGPDGRMEVHGRSAVGGEDVERLLVDRLQVFKGGEFSRASATPLWDSGEIEYGELGDILRLRMPATSAAVSFRKFVEALEKSD